MGFDFTTRTKAQLEEIRIIAFNRVPQRLDLVRKSTNLGAKLLMDLDDHWELYPEHPMYPMWTHNKMPTATIEMIKSVHAVTCTTSRLADKIKPFNKNVYVIPNAIPFEGQFLSKGRDHLCRQTRFGYIGGSSHLADIKRIAGVFNHFPTLDFTLFGYQPMPPGNLGKNVWDQIQAVCNFNGNNPNFRRADSKSLDSYMEHYETIDIAIAPLKDTPFNTFKSSLKFYEAAAKACAFICSDMAPYSDDVPKDITFMCKTNKEWIDAIKKCKDPNLVSDLGAKSYAWVKEHRNMEKINKLRLEVYEELLK